MPHLLPIYLPGFLSEITFAGTPAAVILAGISLVTTAPAPIVTLFPIFTFSTIETCGPIYTLSP